MEGETPTNTGENLISNPFTSRRVGVEEVQKTSSDGGNGTTADEERLVVSEGGHKSTADDGRDGNRDDHGQVADTTHGR